MIAVKNTKSLKETSKICKEKKLHIKNNNGELYSSSKIEMRRSNVMLQVNNILALYLVLDRQTYLELKQSMYKLG